MWLAYPYAWRGFVGAKKKTSEDLLVFNPNTTKLLNIPERSSVIV
jgi:hypothetical protein